jgi:hypothetical protein
MAIDKQQVEVALKLKLEAEFQRSLINVYGQIVQESTEHYANTQQAKDLSVFFNSLSAVTFLAWLNSRSAFDTLTFKMLQQSKSFMRLMNKIAKIDTTGRTTSEHVLNGIKQNANNQNTAHMNNWIQQAAQSVSDTNQKQLASIVALGLPVFEFREKLKDTFSKRIDTISATTVQEASESTKASIFTESNNVIKTHLPNAKPLKKQWIAVLDDRTRPDHAAADMQIKEMHEPFEVGESLLMYPADSSLGAPLSQTINCRCISIIAGLLTF